MANQTQVLIDSKWIAGSANGDRTSIAPVQLSSVRSISLILRSVDTRRSAKTVPQNPDVAARGPKKQAKALNNIEVGK